MMKTKNRVGFTIIEVMMALAGLAVILLALYTLFAAGMKNWRIINPRIEARKMANDALYGKRGDALDGIAGELRIAHWIGSPTLYFSQPISGQRIYFIKSCTYTTTPNSTTDEVITYYTEPMPDMTTGVNTPLCRIMRESAVGSLSTGPAALIAHHVREGTFTTFVGTQTIVSSSLFTYYDACGNQITNPETNSSSIRQIDINLCFDIDNDRDGQCGEDWVDENNNDGDSQIDEDPPVDFRLKKKVYPIYLE